MSLLNNYSGNFENPSLGLKLGFFQRESALKKSDLDNDDVIENNHNFSENESLDDSIEDLQRQIDETEAAIENITLNIDETKLRHQNELEEIESQIKEASQIAEEELNNQQEQFDQEFNEARSNYEEEIKMLQENLRKGHEGNLMWNNYRQELVILGNQSIIADMERKMENEKNILLESVDNQKMKQSQQNLKRLDIQYENEARLRSLEEQISIVQSQKREKISQSRIKVNELTENIETKTREHHILLEKMTLEFNQRDKHFDAHLQSVRQMIEREKMKSDSDNQILNNKIESLQKILSSVSKRGSMQLQEMMRDIEKMKKSIDDAKRNEDAFVEKSRQQMAKMLSIQKETQANRDIFQSLQNDLNNVKALNLYATQELQKAANLSSRSNLSNRNNDRLGYSSTRGNSKYTATKNSIFY